MALLLAHLSTQSLQRSSHSPHGTDLGEASQVRPTGDSRGNGAFAVQDISQGTFLGPYEGELLDEAQYWSRYPNGMVGTDDLCAWMMREDSPPRKVVLQYFMFC